MPSTFRVALRFIKDLEVEWCDHERGKKVHGSVITCKAGRGGMDTRVQKDSTTNVQKKSPCIVLFLLGSRISMVENLN